VTASAFFMIWCEWPGCHAAIDTSETKAADARAYAAKQGWTRAAGMDLCGSSEQAGEFSTGGPGWKGHASDQVHRPIVKAAGKNIAGLAEVTLSCKCGWTVPAEHSWETAGRYSRSIAGLRWRDHVKEASVSPTDANPVST